MGADGLRRVPLADEVGGEIGAGGMVNGNGQLGAKEMECCESYEIFSRVVHESWQSR